MGKRIILQNKKEEPPFKFYVRENTSNFDYYAYNDFEEAMGKARTLSLTEFPIVVVMEPDKDRNGEWKLVKTFVYVSGKCKEDGTKLLHVKFYTDAGMCLNR